MDFNKLKTLYRQFGGIRLVVEYAKLGALLPAIKAGVKCLIKRQSFKEIYPETLSIIEPYLIERYRFIIQEFKRSKVQGLTHKRSRTVWFCWLQGIEKAPPIVKVCYNSLQRHLVQEFKVQDVQGYEIKIIDNENWKRYVDLPNYIIKKWENGRIPAALFSDLLRLELLIKYGGTWIDSTVLCTGVSGSKGQEFMKYLDADLFLFQYTKLGSIPVSISNWFITAYSNNEVLIVLRDMLYAYWKDYDCTLDYYIFHLFFSMISREFPEEIAAMPYGSSYKGIALSRHWGECFNQKAWNNLTANVSIHKLAHRVRDEVKNNKESYYSWIIANYKN